MVFAQSLRFRQHDLELEPAVALNRPTLSLLKHFLDGLVGGSSAAVLQWPAGQRDVSTLHPLAMLAMIGRSEEHTSELQSLMRISYAVFCLKKNKHYKHIYNLHRVPSHPRPQRI